MRIERDLEPCYRVRFSVWLQNRESPLLVLQAAGDTHTSEEFNFAARGGIVELAAAEKDSVHDLTAE